MSEIDKGSAPSKPRNKRSAAAPVVLESTINPKKPLLKQGTTWAGIFTVAAAVASGGMSVLIDPTLASMIGAGVALLFAEN